MNRYHRQVELMLSQLVREGAQIIIDTSRIKILLKAEDADATGAYECMLYVDDEWLFRDRKNEYGQILSRERYLASGRWEKILGEENINTSNS